ncbi:hypothetical protein ACOJUR_05965 [Alicyclobacillus tolerans]|uniref:hypothetical protein n=1 Tax=Alicyclobacillus tolerans TaxID=90970 RepID=UPI003B7FF6CE
MKARQDGQATIERLWKPLFAAIDKSRLRRAKTGFKQGEIVQLRFSSGEWLGSVALASGYRRIEQFHLPALGDWRPYASHMAKWLARRPDWYAELLSGVWGGEWLDWLEHAGLPVVPNEQTVHLWRQKAHCTCEDGDPFCRHVLAGFLFIVEEMQASPIDSFRFFGLHVQDFQDSVHQAMHKLWQEQFPDGKIRDGDSVHSSAEILDNVPWENLKSDTPLDFLKTSRRFRLLFENAEPVYLDKK